MQSRDEIDNIVQSVPVNLGNLEDLAAKIGAAKSLGAKSHTIGQLPEKGKTLTINGLSFRVISADYVKGKFTVKLTLQNK